ncbi:MAG: hypothetical protein IPN37_21075 [Betaproteobacteria bacterium]|nr:hypothetical protein [Betaproteobacteria bacterium]
MDGSGNPVFTGGVSAYGPPSGWAGSCPGGEGFVPAQHCNNKLIGAQFFNAGFLATGVVQHWTESHLAARLGTASAASGRARLAHLVHGGGQWCCPGGAELGVPMGLGLGHRTACAAVAAYKVCWTFVDPTNPDGSGNRNCYTSDSVAAIDKAVADGVHVTQLLDQRQPDQRQRPRGAGFPARLGHAGVFVAASAGNSGPGNAVAHVSPWLTTVAATTDDLALTGQRDPGQRCHLLGRLDQHHTRWRPRR